MTELRLPNLIIGGVHKAGTTSVYTYLSMHPDVCGSSTKEIGFFMPLRYGREIPSMEKYASYFSHCEAGKKYRLEASPSYLYGKEMIAERISKELGSDVKMIFIFRNPADRLFSFYERKKANAYLTSDVTFEDFIRKSVAFANQQIDEHREDEEALFMRGIQEGYYIDYLPAWYNLYSENLKILFFEDLKKDAFSFMKEVCDWLHLDFSIYKPEDFAIENQTIAYKNRWMHKAMLTVNKKFESFWRKNVGLKRTLRGFYKKVNANSGGREKMNAEERQFLDELYQPYNKRLAEFLRGKGITQLPDWLN
ncbi:MAG: sulfotransferase domain-containing protein [Chitinophagaceae bacterium]|nr:sulfotransferase domain-containing protein [Chitinophagaceae bacterium]